MQNKKYLFLLLTILLTATTLFGCAPAEQQSQEGSFSITDQKDREISFNENANTFVSLAPSITEILFALDLGEQVLGVTEYCNYPEAALEKEKMGGFEGPNVEMIVAAAPDVVFASAIAKEPVDQLENAGIKVVVLDPQSIDEVYQAISLAGKVAAAETKAQEIITEMQAEIASVKDTISGAGVSTQPVVYYEVWHDPPMTAGPNTFIAGLIHEAGGVNLANDAEVEWPTYSPERIVAKNPDFIVLGHGGQQAAQVKERAGWQGINAVKNDNIKVIDPDIIARPGPRVVEALKQLAQFIYPNEFTD